MDFFRIFLSEQPLTGTSLPGKTTVKSAILTSSYQYAGHVDSFVRIGISTEVGRVLLISDSLRC